MTEHLWLQELRDRTIRDELDRRHPDRVQLRPKDVSGLARALDVRDAMWEGTIEHAKQLPPPLLHERVDGEYSFVETFRHLLFAWDSWLTRMVLRVPNAYHEWAVAPDSLAASVVELEPVLAVRAERTARIRDYLASATDADLSTVVSPPDTTGFPQTDHPVLYCFRVVLNDEWWHHQYATRDLAALRDQ